MRMTQAQAQDKEIYDFDDVGEKYDDGQTDMLIGVMGELPLIKSINKMNPTNH